MNYRLTSILLILSLTVLSAQELVWNKSLDSGLHEKDFNTAIEVYVNKNYPKKVARYKEAHRTVSYKGLMWQDNDNAQTLELSWPDAKTYCKNLYLANFKDWRLPNETELFSLWVKSCTLPKGFKQFKTCHTFSPHFYWSLSPNTQDGFPKAVAYYSKTSARIGYGSLESVRCVRDLK